MAQPSSQKSRRGLVGCLLFAFLLLGVILVIVGAAYWGSRRVSAAVSAKPFINISSPAPNSRVEQNMPLLVNARAEHSAYISRVELYADGALVSVQQSTLPNGSNPLMFMQGWTPTTLGRHVLLARAYSKNGQFADSSVVYVDVVTLLTPLVSANVDAIPRREGSPSPSLTDIAGAIGTTPERLREANPPLRGLDLTRPITPGTPIDIPLLPAPPPAPPGPGSPPAPPPPAPSPGAPTPPSGLIATTDCVNAGLTWSDSPDEEQYVVYRLAPGDSTLNRIATLPANAITYLDTLSGLGVYRYQVAAVRGGIEGLSGMAETMTPGTCVPPAIAPRLVVSILSVDTTEAWARGLYCWHKIDTSEWDRVPAGIEALSPLSTNPRRYDFTRLPGGLRFTFDHADTNPVVIGMDCWGRSDTTASQLNPRFTTNHPPEEWDGTTREFAAPNGSFRVRFCISRNLEACGLPRIGGLVPWRDIDLTPVITLLTLPRPTNLRIRGGVEACDELPTGTERGACVLAIIFGGADTVYWDWSGGAIYNESKITGYHLVVRNGGSILYERDVHPGLHKFTLARTGDLPCGAHITYSVQAVAGASRSGYGTPVAYDTRACPHEVELTVTYNTFTLGSSVDNGDICIFCTDRRLELYGGFGVQGPVSDGWSWLGSITRLPSPSNPFDVLSRPLDLLLGLGRLILTGCPDWATCVSGGTYNFSGQHLIRSGDVWGRTDSNTLTFTLTDGETLTLGTAIADWDILNSSDSWCVTRLEIAHTMDEWGALNETVTLTDDRGEGSCAIQVQIRGRTIR